MTQLQFPVLTKMKIANLNVRDEVHGKDHTAAIDIALSCTTSNALLDQIEPGLCSMFYMAADDQNTAQPELDGVPAISTLPKLRTTLIKSLSLDKEYVGYDLSIQGGTGDLTIGDMKFNKLKVNLLEGGSVNWTFRLQVSGVEAETIGYFGTHVQQWVEATLTISESAQQTILEAEGNVHPIKTSEKKKPEPTATDLFVEGATKSTDA